MTSPLTPYPHPYGDCDACGDPSRLLDVLPTEAQRLSLHLVDGITSVGG